MSTATVTADELLDGFREVDARSNDGVDVALYWSPNHAALRLRVEDWKLGAPVRVYAIPPTCARDAFNHPFPYCQPKEALS